MGIGVSGYALARAVALLGQLGVVSGTSLDSVFARRLQLGDIGGHMRRAVEKFPYPEIAERVWKRWFINGGKSSSEAFRLIPLYSPEPPQHLTELTVLANFAEVFLSKEGHAGVVGINFLEKIQMPTLPSLFGAMLAGVDYVLMGAGIPRAIPGILDDLAVGRTVRLKLDVEDAHPGEEFACTFDPRAFCNTAPKLKRPHFLAVIASATLAITLARKSTGRVDGFVVEGATAGGHNAPPRGIMQISEIGEPIYGERDSPEIAKIKALGLPFWLAGSFGVTGRLAEAQSLGATGIQAGTAFAFCEESGIAPEWKERVLEQSRSGTVELFTDPVASPTGFPFKIVQAEGTLSEPSIYAARERICDLGYLRQVYRKDDGTLGYRCPGEPVQSYLRKGGDIADTVGRKCLCNGLTATIGLAQMQGADIEKPLLTAGNEVANVAQFLATGRNSYTAAEVVQALLK